MKRTFRTTSIISGLMICLAACTNQTGSPEESPMQASRTVSEIREETKPSEETVTLIHVNDVHGYVEDEPSKQHMFEGCIGYAKIAGYIARQKEEKKNVFALDAGDAFSGHANTGFDKGQSVAEILMTVPFDVMVLGNSDFFLGRENLLKLTDQLEYPCLAGNVTSVSGEAPWAGSMILETEGGAAIGIVTATCGVHKDLIFQDPIKRLKEQVAIIRPQVDILIVLSHLGYEDSSGNTSRRVAQEVEGIDLIIDGHSHTVLKEGEAVNGVLIAQAGQYGSYIGVVELSLKNKSLTEARAALLSYDDVSEAAGKEDTEKAVEELLNRSRDYFASEVGQTAVALTAARDLVRTQETNLGNLVADAVRTANRTEIALAISGGIGGEIGPGPITKRDILSIGRVNSIFAVYKLTGADILAALNERCGPHPEPSGNFLQVSGISFTLNSGREPGDRICDVFVHGEPLDLERIYTVSTNEGMSADTGFVNGTLVSRNPVLLQDIVEQYIKENSPVNPQTEGRIRILAEN